jgi:nicotinamide phosphoribosyltransferase
MNTLPEILIDGYKADHKRQYPIGTQVIASNMTARGTRRPNTKKVVFFGVQYFLKEYLVKQWNENFFSKPKEEVITRFKRRINNYLGPDNQVGVSHIEDLHDLGYLPVSIWALPEGTEYNLRIPCLVIYNTNPDFFWITNYLETIMSTTLWGPSTSATTALQYKKLLNEFAKKTVGNTDFVQFQGHDFSFRGMFGMEAAVMSGGAHLTSFVGTDTIPAIDWLEQYYNADSDKELVGCSVPATEHSVACSTIIDFTDRYKKETPFLTDENLMKLADIEYVLKLINEIYPKGIVSIVSDSFDYWNTITNTVKVLKDQILNRDGKTVFRPDTGDPVKIVCGYTQDEYIENDGKFICKKTGNVLTEHEIKGSIQCLWDVFGGTETEKGYKVLDPHVGLIYGDSITLERAQQICQGLMDKGFASTNIVFGIGSYTYQYVTRDTDGYAIKATFCRVSNQEINIYKKPKTGDGTKNSALGLVAVFKDENGNLYLKDQATWDEVKNCEFKNVFHNGELFNEQSLKEIRERINLI